MYYVDLDLVDNAKELIESSVKMCQNFFEEDDKNVSIDLLFEIATKGLANTLSSKPKNIQPKQGHLLL
jgi:hypothetical protein